MNEHGRVALPGNDQDGPGHSRRLRLSEAHRAHARGWKLTPLDGKRPIKRGWQREEAPSQKTLDAWARRGNLGLRTGRASGVVVIDDDTPGGSGAAQLHLPRTPAVRTGSGKHHYYFKAPAEPLGNSSGRLASGVDFRADGGQVVFVGSVHPETGGVYRWVEGCSPDDLPLAELPDALLQVLRTPRSSRRNGTTGAAPGNRTAPLRQGRKRAESTMHRAVAHVLSASEGERNDTLNRESFRVGRHVGAGLLEREIAEVRLRDAALEAGLTECEVERTLRSGLDAGASKAITDSGARTRSGRPRPSTGQHNGPDEHLARLNGSSRPCIVVEGGKLTEILDQAEEALLRVTEIYQRGTHLVRPVRDSAMTVRAGIRREPGSLTLLAVDALFLVEQLTRAAIWQKWDGRMDRLKEIDCPEILAKIYLARRGNWKAPELLGVVQAPTIRPDGSILSTPGYDRATRLLFASNGKTFRTVPDRPTLADAKRACEELLEPLRDFPWLEPSDRSAALAAILTALARHSLRTAPLFAFRAPKMGSGKSLLADVVSLVATGRPAPVMTPGRDEDEDRKRILAVLMEGVPVSCIDNIEKPLGGAAISSVLTQETFRDRVLGRTETAIVPTTTTWLATGNNLVLRGDLSTRVVPCDLDPRCERPEQRSFKVNLYEHVPSHRDRLVPAALTILRAYHVAGRPTQPLPPFGRFEDWSNLIRSSLVWCGEPDPCAGRSRLEEDDPERLVLREFLRAWRDGLGSELVTSAELIHRSKRPGHEQLHELLAEVCMGRDRVPSSKRLGHWILKHERRIEAGLRVERAGKRQGANLWRVHAVQPG